MIFKRIIEISSIHSISLIHSIFSILYLLIEKNHSLLEAIPEWRLILKFFIYAFWRKDKVLGF